MLKKVDIHIMNAWIFSEGICCWHHNNLNLSFPTFALTKQPHIFMFDIKCQKWICVHHVIVITRHHYLLPTPLPWCSCWTCIIMHTMCWMPEMEWVQYKCTRVRVRLLWTCMSMITSTSTQKTNVLEYEYDYFTMYSSTITLECNHDYFHDYFNEYPVSNIKVTFMESLGVILVLLLCH